MVDWLTLSQTSGSGYELITVTAPPNTGVSRTSDLTVSAGTSSIVVPVLQYGAQEPGPSGYTGEYLTLEIVSGGTLIFGQSGDHIIHKYLKTVQYSINGGPWTDWTSYSTFIGQYYYPSSAATITVEAGDYVRLRGNNSTYGRGYWSSTSPQGSAYALELMNAGFFGTATFNLSGNILSLVYGDNYYGYHEITTQYTFCRMFSRANVIDASNLILPFNRTTDACCYEMFERCPLLVSAPELPATELAGQLSKPDGYYSVGRCYQNMFRDCTSLVNPPSVLPALTANNDTYNAMFKGCTSLTTGPVISATTVGYQCMSHMFGSCTSLLAAPDLLATTARTRCYHWMFYDCTSLSSIKCMLERTTDNALDNWVHGVASAGTFTKSTNASFWTTGDSGIPNNWTIQNE